MSAVPINILVVEDDKVFAGLVGDIVTEEGRGAHVVTVTGSVATATQLLAEGRYDLVLLDLTLPDRQGLGTFLALQQCVPLVPVIVLSGLSDEAVALQALRAGAQDYLLKNEFDGRLLARAIRYAMERKAAEVRLRESEEFFRLISENVTDLISVVDANGVRLYNSPSYHAVLGQRDLLTGTDSFAEIHPEDRDAIQGVFREVMATGKGRRAEYRFVRGDGDIRHVESQSNVIRDETGKPRKVVVVSRDVTERLEAERELRQALAEVSRSHEQLQAAQRKLVQSEKLEAVSTFAAGVAHEVKNPLQTVVLGIDYLRDYVVTNDASAADLLQQMSDAVKRADAIVRGLLEFSAYRKGAASDQDLGQLCEQSLAPLETELAGKGIQVRADYAANLPRLRLDPRALKHVLINLLATEINGCRPGDEIYIRTFQRAPAAGPSGRTTVVAEIQVRHSTGAAAEASFVEPPGTGSARDFGTMVARKMIELYGGKLEFKPKPNGNKLTISFGS
jgi:PAS domain S-box-containing protein